MDRKDRQKGNFTRQKGRKTSQFSAIRAMEEQEHSVTIEGRNPVFEALSAGRAIDKLFIAQGAGKALGHIISAAKGAGVPVVECDRRKLDKMSETGSHQGVIAQCAQVHYKEISDILTAAQKSGRPPLIVLCDGITDPHNLGAIIRTAEVAGAHGVIVPRHRSAGLGAACAKAAAGALEHLPIARCANIGTAIRELKKNNIFVFAADMGGKSMYELDMSIPCAIVVGSEGDGISQTSKTEADFIVSIPQFGAVNSLNASNAAAVLLYEAVRKRQIK